MTVKELFQSLDFKEIIEPLVLKYPNALEPMSRYKENYDIILNTAFSGEGGTITFHPDGNSDVYMIEGDRYFNIVGMDVILPENGAVTKAEAAADILWSSLPFGDAPIIDWAELYDSRIHSPIADNYELQAKRLRLKMALPYCRDKNICKELKREMQSPYFDELCLSGDASMWFVFGKGKHWGKRHNRSKRKRLYRMEKRSEELYKLSELHNQLALLEAKIGSVPEHLEKLVFSSSSIKSVSYKSKTFGKSDRIDYIADLLLNPMYNSLKPLDSERTQECICVLYTSTEHPCTEVEQNRIEEIISSYFGNTRWQFYTNLYNSIGNEVELDITYITQ